ncbi:transposase [Pseudarthrobacter siccitolerans]|uniref:transposase n=1 Tax=Pseudarthrobacter siccitolerans TaxID=861266 RepID=UPI0027B9271F|nr:transposase [Pseudarthrobacter siccitolerans]
MAVRPAPSVAARVQVVAIDPSAAFRKALRTWLPRTAVSVDLFHMTMLASDMLTTVRQGLSQQVRAGGAGPRTLPGRTGCCC